MSHSFRLRNATLADAPTLVALNRSFNGADHVETDPAVVAKSLERDDGEIVLVAEGGGGLVGFACVQAYRSFRYPRPSFELTELYVRRSWRRRGVATALIEEVRALAVREHALEINLRVNRGNEEALRFYEASRFEEAPHAVFRVRYYDSTPKRHDGHRRT